MRIIFFLIALILINAQELTSALTIKGPPVSTTPILPTCRKLCPRGQICRLGRCVKLTVTPTPPTSPCRPCPPGRFCAAVCITDDLA